MTDAERALLAAIADAVLRMSRQTPRPEAYLEGQQRPGPAYKEETWLKLAIQDLIDETE